MIKSDFWVRLVAIQTSSALHAANELDNEYVSVYLLQCYKDYIPEMYILFTRLDSTVFPITNTILREGVLQLPNPTNG